jgi:aminoglycoside 6'-N-acetyltransferase
VAAATPLPTLSGDSLTLRAPQAEDAPALAAILAEPEVERWWGAHDVDAVRELIASNVGWVIVVDGALAGWLECWEEREPRCMRVGLDIFITTALFGKGPAREAMRMAIAHFVELGHHRFTIDPAAANARAIGAYSALGFKSVGVMRSYERDDTESPWHDNLLMDLLAEELVS